MIGLFCFVYYLAAFFIYPVIFSIHFMFAQVFHFDRSEGSQTCMQCKLGKADTFYLTTLNKFFAEMKTCGWCRHCSFILRIYCLIAFFIFFIGFALDVFWQRRFAQKFQHISETGIIAFP